MSLRKSPTLTPARLEANRRNAKKSTGPRTARGKRQSRMNSLKTGGRSALHENFFLLLLDAPPCSVDRVAQALLTPEQAAHPLFAETVDMFRRAESEVAAQSMYKPPWFDHVLISDVAPGFSLANGAPKGGATSKSGQPPMVRFPKKKFPLKFASEV